MPRTERQDLIKQIQTARSGRLLMTYITSTRPGHEVQMADDILRLVYEHLENNKVAAAIGVDLFIHSNGGSGMVPWRIVSLIREYTKKFAVLVPHHAFSAATLTALGADEIIMHKMGNLGPIDPSVANIFNPPHPHIPGASAPISVEDVSAYFRLVKDEVGITHEDELVQALTALTEKIHPLALGNVQRHHSQSRLMARKLLKKHMVDTQSDHEIEQLIDNLKSNLFFHGHPINRDEAKADLKLKITEPDDAMAELMWKLFVEYEVALKMREPFSALHELEVELPAAMAAATVTTQDILQQLQQLAQAGLPLGTPGLTTQQIVDVAASMLPHLRGAGPAPQRLKLDGMAGAYTESQDRTWVFKTDMTLSRVTIATPQGPQEAVKQEIRWQRWEVEQ
jgi:hypothetical protein